MTIPLKNLVYEKIKEQNSCTDSELTKALVKDGIVRIQFIKKRKTYQIRDKKFVDRLIEDYHPNILEKTSDSFADIINSL